MRLLSYFLFGLFLVGTLLVFHEPLREEGTIYHHFLMTVYIVFGMGGLGLMIKKYIYYQYADNIRVAFLNRRSGFVDNLLFKIIMIGIVTLLNIAFFNWGLDNWQTTCLLLTTGISIVAVLLNVRPALVLTHKGFYYDDYVPLKWLWKELETIEFLPAKILLKGKHADFEVALSLLQKENNIWSRILDSEVQQFGGAEEDFQEWLYTLARLYHVPCNTPPFIADKRIVL